MAELTDYQQAVLARLDDATALGVVGFSLTVMLLAIIAIRSLWSR